jgi:nitroimidazol reductase NimA-like FMN-containing flavoprotein (pyridoxamine 5'-phosphate oxidase superfamily)
MSEPVELSGSKCLELLARHGVGRVAFGTPMGPRIVPVKYRLDGSEILFRATPYSEVGTYAPRSEVAFEIDEVDAEGHCGCAVVALGRAEVAEDVTDDVARALTDDLAAAAGDAAADDHDGGVGTEKRSRWIRVCAHDFTGMRADA